ncbi:MAG: outer membrane beta-barrel protein [Myxococcales bacterium]|nr:outer membrane beta-barrel protein [Myxococcales bacterium]
MHEFIETKALGRSALISALAVLFFIPLTASAQSSGSSVSVPRPAAGVGVDMGSISKNRGLRSGDFELLPSVGVDGHYDTNVFNGNEDENNVPQAAASVRIAPRLSLNNGTKSEVQFRFGAAGDIRLYMSDKENISNLNNFGGKADLNVDFAARRAISFAVFNNFSRSLRPNNWETTETLNRINNQVGARVSFHPGETPERRPLEISLQGAYVIDNFEDFDFGNSTTVRSRLTGSWRFLPRTAAILDAGWDFRKYHVDNPALAVFTSDSSPWRVQGGLAGALTSRITFRLTAGWGMSMHEKGESFNSMLGNISLGYAPSATTFLSVGYARDFRQSYYGNFIDTNRGTVSLQQRFGRLMEVTAWFNFTYGMYGAFSEIPANTSVTQLNRKDYMLDGGLRALIEVSRLIGVQVGYTLRGVITNFKITSADDRVLDVGAFMAHEIYAGLSIRY